MNGYIKLYRSLMDWEWYQDGNTLRVFLHLLLDANHKKQKWQGVEINPGQTITSYEMISKKTGISVQSVRTSIKRLKSTGELTSKSTNRYTLITIANWGFYQNGDANLTSELTGQLTINQQATNKQLTTNKNVKNEEESKEAIVSHVTSRDSHATDKNRLEENIYTNQADAMRTHSDRNAIREDKRREDIYSQQVADKWNQIVRSLPKVSKITETRRKAIKSRSDSLDEFETVFKKVEASDFLSGRDGNWGGCGFDWVLKQSNWMKIVEGNYDNKKQRSAYDQFETLSDTISDRKISGR